VGSLELVLGLGLVFVLVLENNKIHAGDESLLVVFENMQQKQAMEH
jgi:hypothetical protein